MPHRLSAARLVSILLEDFEIDPVRTPAIRLPNGQIITGYTHAVAWDEAMEAGDLDHLLSQPYAKFDDRAAPWEELEPVMKASTDGFLTAAGKFVDRNEAHRIASKHKQVVPGSRSARSGRMDSDDLMDEALLEDRSIRCAAVRLPGGRIITGQTHSMAWSRAAMEGELDAYLSQPYDQHGDHDDALAELAPVMADSEEGFLTTSGGFVDRSTAYRVAQQAGQLRDQDAGMADHWLDTDSLVMAEALADCNVERQSVAWAEERGYDTSDYPEVVPYRLTCGACCIDFERNDSMLWTLMVETPPGERNKGHARRAHTALYQYARENGLQVTHGAYTEDGAKYLQKYAKANPDVVAEALLEGKPVVCHKTKSIYFTGPQKPAKALAVKHGYRLVRDGKREQVLWRPKKRQI